MDLNRRRERAVGAFALFIRTLYEKKIIPRSQALNVLDRLALRLENSGYREHAERVSRHYMLIV